ncbi:hypothetical protein [Sphingomonas sp. ACRSK]|uniref:hypothetical protein n=1 Tax=Sphingomonas sp. ACRSK TaxID=2918213 RepID=UPI001EF71509|nr:hypothetical protein [Sphingomonas sp. ACRSK]
MDATVAPRRLSLPAATAAAVLGGGVVALIVLLLPTAFLERQVGASGLPDVLAAAAPPLGVTARLALMLFLGGVAAGLMWGLGRIAFGKLPLVMRLPTIRHPRRAAPREIAAIPVLRRGDAHPDAPARAPVLAMRDLGTPFLEVTAASTVAALPAEPIEQALPEDLDLPLAAFDPDAIPVPVEPPRPLFHIDAASGEGADAVLLTRQIRAGFAAPPEPEPEPPVEESSTRALLVRLERGLARRERGEGAPQLARGSAGDETLQATLASLRRWATSA